MSDKEPLETGAHYSDAETSSNISGSLTNLHENFSQQQVNSCFFFFVNNCLCFVFCAIQLALNLQTILK